MPSSSSKQHGFMAMSRSTKGRAKLRASGKKPAPAGVADEFMKADTGHHFKRGRKKHG